MNMIWFPDELCSHKLPLSGKCCIHEFDVHEVAFTSGNLGIIDDSWRVVMVLAKLF